MPGRKNVPTNLKILRGNPGKRALPTDEPKPKAVCPDAPEILCSVAKAHWDITVVQLYDAKVMTELDVDMLTLYCQTYARWVDATKTVIEYGAVVKSKTGHPFQSPYLTVANKALEQMRGILVEFGMSPASRTKIQTVDKQSDKDGWDDA